MKVKASEVSQEGYYWYFDCGLWAIAEFQGGCLYYGDGSAEWPDHLRVDRELHGPIKPPCDEEGWPV